MANKKFKIKIEIKEGTISDIDECVADLIDQLKDSNVETTASFTDSIGSLVVDVVKP